MPIAIIIFKGKIIGASCMDFLFKKIKIKVKTMIIEYISSCQAVNL
jgi:hypothetical protein